MNRYPLALLVAALALPASAQCPDLDLRFRSSPVIDVASVVAFDAGQGEHLFAAVPIFGVEEWDGSRWSRVEGSPSGLVTALAVHDFGSGAELVVAGAFTTAGSVPTNHIARWNGSTWSALGAGLGTMPSDSVRALATFDAGSGPRLVATGWFTQSGSTAVAYIAEFDGTNWQPLGSGLDAGGKALAVADFGQGAELFVGGEFTLAGSQPAPFVARWNGNTWSALGSGTDSGVSALVARGVPGSQQLIVGGNFTAAGGTAANFVARWDGTTWNPLGSGLDGLGPFLGGVLTLMDDGADILAAGAFRTPGVTSPNIARFDGTSWQPLATGLGTESFVGVHALARFDPANGGGSRLFAAGNFTPQPGQPRGIAQWDGTRWSALRDDDAQGLLHQPSDNGITSATMWQGDLVVAGAFSGAGSAPDAASVARWDGTTWNAMGAIGPTTFAEYGSVVEVVDLGTGPELLLGMQRYFTHDASVPVYRWNGAAWMPLAAGTLPPETSTGVMTLEVFDAGTGPRLFAAGQSLRTDAAAVPDSVLQWDGTAWSRLVPGPTAALSGYVSELVAFDDGSGTALYAGGTIAGGVQRWDGSNWSLVGAAFTTTGGQVSITDLHVFDDGQGPRLYAAGAFMAVGSVPATGVARWNGTSWEALTPPNVVPGMMLELDSIDLGTGGGRELLGMSFNDELFRFDGNAWTKLADTDPYFTFVRIFASEDLPGGAGVLLYGNFRDAAKAGEPFVEQAGETILRACPRVESFCAGDGLDTALTVACPCANIGASGHGCAWSTSGAGASGAVLALQGSPAHDDAVLVADSMPANGPSLFFQGAAANRSGAVFGDGLRCTAGPTVRLRTRMNSAGHAEVPSAGDPSLSVLGGVAPGSGATRAYQVWFRVAANFCTSATSNTSNALSVRW